MTSVLLRSGRYFNFLNLESNHYCIEDVAHGLSNQCRYAGQCASFYSVAQHCVLASELADTGYNSPVDKECRYAILMHDMTEFVLGDVPSPLKSLLPDYRELETRLETVMTKVFGTGLQRFMVQIKVVDMQMLATEMFQLMRGGDTWEGIRNINRFNVTIKSWPPERARQEFLSRYKRLRG